MEDAPLGGDIVAASGQDGPPLGESLTAPGSAATCGTRDRVDRANVTARHVRGPSCLRPPGSAFLPGPLPAATRCSRHGWHRLGTATWRSLPAMPPRWGRRRPACGRDRPGEALGHARATGSGTSHTWRGGAAVLPTVPSATHAEPFFDGGRVRGLQRGRVVEDYTGGCRGGMRARRRLAKRFAPATVGPLQGSWSRSTRSPSSLPLPAPRLLDGHDNLATAYAAE